MLLSRAMPFSLLSPVTGIIHFIVVLSPPSSSPSDRSSSLAAARPFSPLAIISALSASITFSSCLWEATSIIETGASAVDGPPSLRDFTERLTASVSMLCLAKRNLSLAIPACWTAITCIASCTGLLDRANLPLPSFQTSVSFLSRYFTLLLVIL